MNACILDNMLRFSEMIHLSTRKRFNVLRWPKNALRKAISESEGVANVLKRGLRVPHL